VCQPKFDFFLIRRQKTDASLHPSSANQQTASPLMNIFTPPVPPLPAEHRSSRTSPIPPDVTSTGSRASDQKPLPPIIHSPSTMRDSEDLDEKSIVFVDKALPLLRSLPPSTPIRLLPATSTGTKRRSMSVGDVDIKSPQPITSVASSPPLKESNSRRNESRPVNSEDNALPGILDLFKGELSMLDPYAGASLDLFDPSTPSRQVKHRSKTDIKGEKLEDKPVLSDPFGGRPNTVTDGTTDTTPIVAFPPRTSSLKSSGRNSITITQPTTLRQSSAPSRSRTVPPTSSKAAQNLSPRTAMRHNSNASISEPSLIPPLNNGRPRKFLTSQTSHFNFFFENKLHFLQYQLVEVLIKI
jgi:PH/SEC7 domain-containing protein